MNCWSCHTETGTSPFCPACGKLNPPSPGATHFQVLGVARAVDLDTALLDQRFRELSLKLHPDRFARSEPRERRHSLEQTTAVNEANRVLKDEVRRAFYLLKLHGVDLDREDLGTQKDLPMEFLEEILERREALDVLRQAQDLEGARRMAEGVKESRRTALHQAQTDLRKLESRPEIPETRQSASHSLAKVRYFDRFLAEVDAMEEEMLG